MSYEQWNWRFFGLEWLNGNKPVQDWFNELPIDAKDEARDTLAYLQHSPITSWRKPKFDPLTGEEVSEIRFHTEDRIYRIYGFHGPDRLGRQVFTLVLGHDKKVRNDKDGKREATRRRGQIERREATVHPFEF